MNYQDTMQLMMNAYPSLFINEDDVLHHLFAVIGNGYDWENGELVDVYNDAPEDVMKEARMRREQHNKDLMEQVERYKAKGWDDLAESFEKMIEPLDPEEHRAHEKARREEMKKQNVEYDAKLYPICEYSKIINVPKDVKPDWLKAAVRAHKLFLSGRYKITDSDREWLGKAGCVNNMGVVSSSGYGDGGYSCYVVKNKGEVVAVKIVFIGKRGRGPEIPEGAIIAQPDPEPDHMMSFYEERLEKRKKRTNKEVDKELDFDIAWLGGLRETHKKKCAEVAKKNRNATYFPKWMTRKEREARREAMRKKYKIGEYAEK